MSQASRRRWCIPVVLLLIATATLVVPAAEATNVAPMTLPALADHAGQVIVGRVAAIQSYWADDPQRIESAVTLEHVEYLKGALPAAGASFTLIVPGGKVGEMELRLGCAPRLAVGEKWMLFLLPRYKTFPTVGVAQGAFRIAADAEGVERVYSAAALPVIGTDAKGFVEVATGRPSFAPEQVVASDNVHLAAAQARAGAPQAVSFAEFRAQLQPVLAASRDHHLTAPAGQRVLVQYRAAPLQLSPAARERVEAARAGPGRRPGPVNRVHEATRSARSREGAGR